MSSSAGMLELERRRERPAAGAAGPVAIEWPTIGLAAVIYGAWLVATFEQARIPLPAMMVLGGWLTAWHGSLQHEIIHGHPTRNRRFNLALAMAPLSLWLPLHSYRRNPLPHHT